MARRAPDHPCRRPRTLICAAALAGTASLAAEHGAAQTSSDPPCAPGVAPSATIGARDLEDGDRALTATHTIVLGVETSDGSSPEFAVALPPGAKAVRAGPDPAFQVDAPGPVPITATWSHFDAGSGSFCTASAETTLDVGAARPPRFIPPPPRSRQMNSLDWRVRFGKNADLRPVEMRLRGVRRARLPRASAPVRTLAFALRRGDRGLAYSGPPERVRRSAGWGFHASFSDRGEIRVTMRRNLTSRRRRGFGFELALVQAGRRIGRTRAVGRCRYLTCQYRTVK